MSDVTSENGHQSPRHLLTREVIAQVFKADKGQDAELLSFELKDFTKKGDNYASFITSIVCSGTYEEQKIEENYVVKVNLAKEQTPFQCFLNMVFEREKKFLTEVLPKINQVLEPQLSLKCFPECFYTLYEEEKQLLFTKNLRIEGFQMAERTQGLPKAEVMMALGILAKFHATSFIVKKHYQVSLKDIFPSYANSENSWFMSDNSATELYRGVLGNSIDQSVLMLEKIGGWDKTMNWLKSSKEDLLNKTFKDLKTCNKKFECILHGDFWNNNLLFR